MPKPSPAELRVDQQKIAGLKRTVDRNGAAAAISNGDTRFASHVLLGFVSLAQSRLNERLA